MVKLAEADASPTQMVVIYLGEMIRLVSAELVAVVSRAFYVILPCLHRTVTQQEQYGPRCQNNASAFGAITK
jgi:hypothetical protein